MVATADGEAAPVRQLDLVPLDPPAAANVAVVAAEERQEAAQDRELGEVAADPRPELVSAAA
jgi:hypothetical protein